MKFTCGQIYDLAVKSEIFYKNKTTVFPVKAGFYIFKNLKGIRQAAEEIEENKKRILQEYCAVSNDEDLENYKIPKDKIDEAQRKLNDLCNIEYEIDLYPVMLTDIEELKLTAQELDVLIPMVYEPVPEIINVNEEEKEEEE